MNKCYDCGKDTILVDTSNSMPYCLGCLNEMYGEDSNE